MNIKIRNSHIIVNVATQEAALLLHTGGSWVKTSAQILNTGNLRRVS